jgi:hypothetical protein
MSSTDDNIIDQLAGALFDEVVSPLGRSRVSAGKQAYFPTAQDMSALTYYSEPLARVMQRTDFEFPGSGTVKGLISALTAHWVAQGEPDLAAMSPRLNEIAEAARDEDAPVGDGDVNIFRYTMY